MPWKPHRASARPARRVGVSAGRADRILSYGVRGENTSPSAVPVFGIRHDHNDNGLIAQRNLGPWRTTMAAYNTNATTTATNNDTEEMQQVLMGRANKRRVQEAEDGLLARLLDAGGEVGRYSALYELVRTGVTCEYAEAALSGLIKQGAICVSTNDILCLAPNAAFLVASDGRFDW